MAAENLLSKDDDDETKQSQVTEPNILFLLVDALDAMARDLQLANVPGILLVIYPSSKGHTARLISLISNLTLETSFIDWADMRKLNDDLKFTNDPMWCLEAVYMEWQ